MTLGKIPESVTAPATYISTTGALLNGTINANDLNTTITFEYGLTESYSGVISASPAQVSGNTTKNVIAALSQLEPATIYHFRIKAVNLLGTSYGSDITFKTTGAIPSVMTNAAKRVTGISASLNGIVNASDLITTVTFEYGESTGYGHTISAIESPVSGKANTYVTASVSGLIPETSYHFRIKAVNSLGTSYGDDIIFTTPPALIYDIDGNSYTAVVIGRNVWLAENLRTTKYNDNTPIPLVTGATQWAGCNTPGYCWYNNDESSYKSAYGALYNWYALDTLGNGGKNVCPSGWHTSTILEWDELIRLVGGEQSGEKLMESGTSFWRPPNSDANNETGFTVLPGGTRTFEGTFTDVGLNAYFLSSSYTFYYSLNNTFCIMLTEAGGAQVWFESNFRNETGGSVRCVMNK